MNPNLVAGLTGLGVLAAGALARAAALRRSSARIRRRLPTSTGTPHPSGGALRAPAAVAGALARAGVDDADRWWTAWLLGTGGCGALVLTTAGPGSLMVVVAASVLVPVAVLGATSGRGAMRREAELPGLLDEVARALRGGSSLVQALETAATGGPGELAAELATVARTVTHSGDLGAHLRRWADRRPRSNAVRLVAGALSLGAETGGAQARAVDGVAATLRDRAAVQAELGALTSQARASAAVMGITPLAFAGLSAITDPRVGSFLLHSPAGIGCLLAGLALDTVGLAWMLRITGAAT